VRRRAPEVVVLEGAGDVGNGHARRRVDVFKLGVQSVDAPADDEECRIGNTERHECVVVRHCHDRDVGACRRPQRGEDRGEVVDEPCLLGRAVLGFEEADGVVAVRVEPLKVVGADVDRDERDLCLCALPRS
jgi:hypothetical protein